MSEQTGTGQTLEPLERIRDLERERDALVLRCDELVKLCGPFPPGHYYSPIVSIADVEQDSALIFKDVVKNIPGIELNEDGQLALLEKFFDFYGELPFSSERTEGLRYFFENPAYSYSDAICLYSMIRHLQPKNVVEVGSGYSSCVTLDTNELFFNNSIKTTFIDPNAAFLQTLMKPEDPARVTVIPGRLQDAELELFSQLEPNDILFIDSTHVCKTGSDVNRIFFEILPALKSGVYVHFHDIFFPFEYPKYWIEDGRSWSEIYLLRAFLQYNKNFKIVLMNTFLDMFHKGIFQEKMPLCLKNPGGSIWLKKE